MGPSTLLTGRLDGRDQVSKKGRGDETAALVASFFFCSLPSLLLRRQRCHTVPRKNPSADMRRTSPPDRDVTCLARGSSGTALCAQHCQHDGCQPDPWLHQSHGAPARALFDPNRIAPDQDRRMCVTASFARYADSVCPLRPPPGLRQVTNWLSRCAAASLCHLCGSHRVLTQTQTTSEVGKRMKP